MNVLSFLLGSTYSGASPLLGAISATCTVNGQVVQCPDWLGPVSAIFWPIFAIIMIVVIIAEWKIFKKTGQPGWAIFVPIYNIIVMLQIIRKPLWWIVLFFIPFVNIIIGIIMVYNLAKVFGKGAGFTIGLILLPIIFLPILGFGKATYQGQVTSQPAVLS